MNPYKQATQRSSLGKIPVEFEVKRSKMLKAKNIDADGLYSRQPWDKGAILGEYRGKRLTLQQALKKKQNTNYMFDVKRGRKVWFVIDAANKRRSSFLRYANSADYESQQNTEYIQKRSKIYLKALRPIKKGEEILAWYGNSTSEVNRQS
jgi:SET domain-containing protein